jgi:hypothetical protein
MGPVCLRELRTASRRWRTYAERWQFAAALALLSGGLVAGWWYSTTGGLSVRALARLALSMFGLAVAAQATILFSMVPQTVARGLAGERDRHTMASLLATAIPSRVVVLGVLVAALARYACWLLVGLPLVLVLTTFGGVDPRAVLLAYLALFVMAFALAGLSLAVAVSSTGQKQAAQFSSGLAAAWMVWPAMITPLASRYAPSLWAWLSPINDWLRASSPMVIVLDVTFGGGWARIERDLGWMIGLQLIAGILLTFWAVARLRPASRRLEERVGATSRKRSRRKPGILHRRPPCGDDPMTWKERHAGRPRSWPALLAGLIVLASFAALLVLLGIYLAVPAFLEWRAEGFRATGPRVMRDLFNSALMLWSGVMGFIYLLVLSGQAAEGIVLERARDTWNSLLTTTLEGPEILRAKRFGAVWRSRFVPAFVGMLWLMGLCSGSVHPIGLIAAAVAFAAIAALASAWGTFCSLVSRDAQQASNRAILPMLILSFTGLLPLMLPPRYASIIEGFPSLPFVTAMGLISPGEVHDAIAGKWSSPITPRKFADAGLALYVASYLLGIAFGFAAAALVRRVAERRFDRAVGRPHRSEPQPAPSAPILAVTLAADSAA